MWLNLIALVWGCAVRSDKRLIDQMAVGSAPLTKERRCCRGR